jgi:hypothetical protein
MKNAPLNVLEGVPCVPFEPEPIERLGDDPELYDEVA